MASATLLLLLVPATVLATGCYSGVPYHHCDCELTEAACLQENQTWTSGCCRSVPPPSPSPPKSCDHGCYDNKGGHRCDCQITSSQCQAGAGIWTTGCGCDNSADPGYKPCNQSDTDYGCYNGGGQHQCDCLTTQSACEANHGQWITGCSCRREPSPPPTPNPPPLPHHGGRVVVELKAECPAITYHATFVRDNLLSSLAMLSAVARSEILVSVGDACDTPYGSTAQAYVALRVTIECATVSLIDHVTEHLKAALATSETASSALGIRVFEAPLIEQECDANGCDAAAATGGMSGGGVAALVLGTMAAVGGLTFYVTRRVYGRTINPTEAFTPPLATTNSAPYVSQQ